MKVKFREKTINIEKEIKVSELLKEQIEENEYQVIGCLVNNEYQNIGYVIKEDSTIELIDISTKEGTKIYRRTLVYIMAKAVEKLYPNTKLSVNYQLANAMFCNIKDIEITEEIIEKIEKEMKNIVKKDLEIKQVIMTRNEAKEFFKKNNTVKGKLQYDLKSNQEIIMYYCEEYYNYCYGTIGNRTGMTKIFNLSKYEKGYVLKYPNSAIPEKIPKIIKMKKLKWALEEYDEIHKILNIETLYKLNKTIEDGKIKEIVLLGEALHEKKIAQIADKISKNKSTKIVLIAGPSSSGKTTFAQRLSIQLRLNKIKPVTISVDNYFVERSENPKDKNGELDFECIEAIDIKLFNEQLVKMLNKEEVEIPEFNFITGKKEYNGKKIKLQEDEILIIEGIHCLNEELTKAIPKEQKYKIYISALTVLNMDRYNRVSTTDTRLIRRIVRDNQFRGYSATHTIGTWYKVNEGEEKNIFPYQEEANSIFNTSLIYEIGVLKQLVMPLLEEIPNTKKEYAEARRILKIIKYFKEIPKEIIPTNSILKEFTGGGDFKY